MKAIAAVLAIPVLALTGLLFFTSVLVQQNTGCGSGDTPAMTVNPAVASSVSVAGVDAEQLQNAATIMNTAAGMNLGRQGQLVGVMTALGESTLRNLDHGDEGDGVTNPDGSATCSVGVFQQQWCLPGHPWGTKTETLDVQHAATMFFTRLQQVKGWQTLPPSQAAHQVQGNADPDHYTADVPLANTIIDALTGANDTSAAQGGDGGCAVSADQVALAKELVAKIDAHKLVDTPGNPDHLFEIKAIAEGTATADCGIDTRILQVIVLATRTFDTVAVSDINRKCTGQIEGAGVNSAHYINGGGHAVDFSAFNGTPTTGADANALKLINLLDPIMPPGSGLGQKSARLSAGNEPALKNFSDFDDTPNHLHIDVGHAKGTLNTTITGTGQ